MSETNIPNTNTDPTLHPATPEAVTMRILDAPVLGTIVTEAQTQADIATIATLSQKLVDTNGRNNVEVNNGSELLERIKRIHGEDSAAYQDVLEEEQEALTVTGGTAQDLIQIQREIADTIMSGDVDKLWYGFGGHGGIVGVNKKNMDHDETNRATAETESAEKRTAFDDFVARPQTAATDLVPAVKAADAIPATATSPEVPAVKAKPAVAPEPVLPSTRDALDHGYDQVDLLRKHAITRGKRNKFPDKSPPRAGFGLRFRGPTVEFEGKVPKVRFAAQDRALRIDKERAKSRSSYDADWAEAEDASLKKHVVEKFVAAKKEAWNADGASREAMLAALRTKGVDTALLEEVKDAIDDRQHTRNEALHLNGRLDDAFSLMPLFAAPTEVAVRNIEDEISYAKNLIDSLPQTDPLRAEIYKSYVINNVKLQQRIAIHFGSESNASFAAAGDRSVVFRQSTGAPVRFYEDGSLKHAGGPRMETNGTEWVDSEPLVADEVRSVFQDTQLDPVTGLSNQEILDLTYDRLATWDRLRDTQREIFAANTLRVATERTGHLIEEIETYVAQLTEDVADIYVQKTELDPNDDNYVEENDRLTQALSDYQSELKDTKSTRNGVRTIHNKTTYFQGMLGITSPKSAGLESSPASMRNSYGDILIQNFRHNNTQGDWVLSSDGTSSLQTAHGEVKYTADGKQII